MQHRIVFATCLLGIAGCSDTSQPPAQEARSAFEFPADAPTLLASKAFFSCLETSAVGISNGREFLDLRRISRVLGECAPEERAVEAAVRSGASKETDELRTANRLREFRAEAIRIIRRNPYEPKVTRMESGASGPDRAPGRSDIQIIETDRAIGHRLQYD